MEIDEILERVDAADCPEIGDEVVSETAVRLLPAVLSQVHSESAGTGAAGVGAVGIQPVAARAFVSGNRPARPRWPVATVAGPVWASAFLAALVAGDASSFAVRREPRFRAWVRSPGNAARRIADIVRAIDGNSLLREAGRFGPLPSPCDYWE